MSGVRYMVVSGFLGAGKTTSMLALSRSVNSRHPLRAAILANDLGEGNIVDAEYTAMSEVMTDCIAGDCICYQHENLVDRLRALGGRGADIVFSDIPGCGIGALDHVYRELANREPGEFRLLPFTCIVDPERLEMLAGKDIGLPGEMRFLLNAQMAEADLIILNKIDTLSPARREEKLALIASLHPDTPVMAMSARSGEGVDAAADYILSHDSPVCGRDIGYGSEQFIAAERLMSWYNRRVFFTERGGRNLDFNAALGALMDGVSAALSAGGGNVPHFKVFASGEDGDYFKASLLGVGRPIEYDRRFERRYTALSVIINARASVDADAMSAAVEDALEAVKAEYNLNARTYFLESFGMMDEGRGNGGRASRYD